MQQCHEYWFSEQKVNLVTLTTTTRFQENFWKSNKGAKVKQGYIELYKSTRALWLVNQPWFIVPVNSRKNRASSELLYNSNRPLVAMVYRHDKPLWMLEEQSKNS